VPGIRGGPQPEAALVCNFPRPGADGAALLDHDDVVTLFHELGHLVHHLFARDQEWVEFSGTATEWDFVEVPSQLLEEWAWDASVLKSFSRHYVTGEEIPDDLIARLRRSKGLGRGLWVRQQMFYASLSLACHNRDPRGIKLDRLEEELQNRYSRFAFVPDTHFHTSFGHLSGYSALYYTYMWSLVIEKDLLSQFRARGLMDRGTAQRYRDVVLAPGGSRDAADLVRDFLGREFQFDAFESWLREA
jgi:thimet oligopeptidase